MSREVGVQFLKTELPEIIIPWDVYEDIKAIVDTRYTEIGWIGEAEKISKTKFRINKVTIPTQEANHTTTEISDEGIFNSAIVKGEIDSDKFRYWGHSHGNMSSVTPSGQDNTQMKEFAESCDWFIGTIHNRDGEMFGYMVDNRRGIYFTNLEIQIEDHPDILKIEERINDLYNLIDLTKNNLLKSREGVDWKALSTERVETKTYNYHNPGGNKNQKQKKTIPEKELPDNSMEQRKSKRGTKERSGKKTFTNLGDTILENGSESWALLKNLDVTVDSDGLVRIEGDLDSESLTQYNKFYEESYVDIITGS